MKRKRKNQFTKAHTLPADPPPAKRKSRQASGTRLPWFSLPKLYLVQHLRVAVDSLGRLWKTPFASALTVAVIAIAIALPMALTLILTNTQNLVGTWDSRPQLSIFLHQDIDHGRADAFTKRLQTRSDVSDIKHLSAAQALQEFQQLSGFGAALDALPDNPLPEVVIVTPALDANTQPDLEPLQTWIKTQPEVEFVQFDKQWMERLQTILQIANRSVILIASILALAVTLVIGNTIRLEIQNRCTEIEVAKLVGATNGFVRRPFLYTGIWYGLWGGFLAWLLVDGALLTLHAPIQRLSTLYGSAFTFNTAPMLFVIKTLFISAFLGWAGALIAVSKHLSYTHPR